MKKKRVALPTREEIDRRLRIVSELRNLCLSLGRVKLAGATAETMQDRDPVRPPDALTK